MLNCFYNNIYVDRYLDLDNNYAVNHMDWKNNPTIEEFIQFNAGLGYI